MTLLSNEFQEQDKINMEDVAQDQNELLSRIIDLAERLQVFSWGLQNYYIDVYLTSDSSRNLEQMNYRNRKYRADADIEELLEDIESFRQELVEDNEEFNNAYEKLEEALKHYNESCTLVDGTYILQKAARDLKSLKYVDAIVNLKELHNRLDRLDAFEGNLAKALRSFRAISDTQLAVSQGQLSVEFSNLFKWEFNRGLHNLTYSLTVQQNDPALLERVLKALYIAEQMVIDIQPFSHFLVTTLLPNVIKHNCEIFTEDRVGALVFNIKIDLQDNERPSIPTIFNNLTAVFEFLKSTMGAKLAVEKTFFGCLGDCNRDEFFGKLIQDCIKNNLPYNETNYQAYKEIALELETFNKFLVDIDYVEAEKSPLKKYIDHTDLLMYETKCRKMLMAIRELTKENLAQTTVTVGSESCTPEVPMLDVTNKAFRYDLNTPLFFPKCAISQNVKKIAALLTTHVEDSANLPIIYTNQLIPYIKDIAMMYQGMVIQRNGIRLRTHALEIALFFNNCQYLAHSLVGPPWKNILPDSVADKLNATLMSTVYDLRLVGIEKLSVFFKQNRQAIFDKIRSVFQNWDLDTFEKFNRDVNHVLILIRYMRNTWFEVLPDRMFQRGMCVLVEALCEAMLRVSLRYVHDITEDVVCLLASRYQYTIDEVLDMYPEITSVEPKVKHWEKLLMMPKMFTAQILEISRMWNEGNTLRTTFTCEEVRLIIKMRFPNNDYRLKILKEIQ